MIITYIPFCSLHHRARVCKFLDIYINLNGCINCKSARLFSPHNSNVIKWRFITKLNSSHFRFRTNTIKLPYVDAVPVDECKSVKILLLIDSLSFRLRAHIQTTITIFFSRLNYVRFAVNNSNALVMTMSCCYTSILCFYCLIDIWWESVTRENESILLSVCTRTQ